jgi:hypothetical protein
MTPLDKSLKRALQIKGVDYVVTLGPDALKVTRKGRRLGLELKWSDLISGESALAVALRASVGQFDSVKKPPREEATNDAPKVKTPSKRSRRGATRPSAKMQPR